MGSRLSEKDSENGRNSSDNGSKGFMSNIDVDISFIRLQKLSNLWKLCVAQLWDAKLLHINISRNSMMVTLYFP